MKVHATRPTPFFILLAILGFAALCTAANGQYIAQDRKLIVSDTGVNAFGEVIAVDDEVVVASSVTARRVFLFNAITGDKIVELVPNTSPTGFSSFGLSLAVQNGVVAVSDYEDDTNGVDSGAVYLFDAVTGAQTAIIHPDDAGPGQFFGFSVAIDNGLLVVGAPGPNIGSGSAYVFDLVSGIQLSKHVPSDGLLGDLFGFAVDIDNGIVLVGSTSDDDNGNSSGSAYLFDQPTGIEIAKLLPDNGNAGDGFGNSVGLDSGLAAVGTEGGNTAYIFDSTDGTQLFELVSEDISFGDQFGRSIGIDDGIVAVGARFKSDNGIFSGAAYLFDAGSGAQIAKLLREDGYDGDRFGHSITISGGVVAVGAYLDGHSGIVNAGSVYLFSAPQEACVPDINGDGTLNFFDISAFLQAFSAGCP